MLIEKLYKQTVLVLNKNWQAIAIKSPAETFSMLVTEAATGLDIQDTYNMTPLKWKDWIRLPVSDNDDYVQTVNMKIKIPRVIILSRYDKVPKKRPKFSQKNIWVRDDYTCQYTGKKLKPNEGNIDHIIPRSRGGANNWDNCVLTCKSINAKKANNTPEEVGLKLIRQPKTPRETLTCEHLHNKYNIAEWNIFLKT
jgi:5-methylcytosine-specific restriction endonuclease McrA